MAHEITLPWVACVLLANVLAAGASGMPVTADVGAATSRADVFSLEALRRTFEFIDRVTKRPS